MKNELSFSIHGSRVFRDSEKNKRLTDMSCELIGTLNRYGNKKIFNCYDLPAIFIHKEIKNWMCIICIENLFVQRLKEGVEKS